MRIRHEILPRIGAIVNGTANEKGGEAEFEWQLGDCEEL